MARVQYCRSVTVWLVLAALAATQGGCRANPPSDASKPSGTESNLEAGSGGVGVSNGPDVQPTDRDTTSAVETATRWLMALRARDNSALAKLTGFPFEFRDTGTEGECRSGTAVGPRDADAVLGCLSRDDLLAEELRATSDFGAKVIAGTDVPPWALPWVRQLSPPSVPVWSFIHGNGVSFELVVLVEANTVRGLLKDAQFESN